MIVTNTHKVANARLGGFSRLRIILNLCYKKLIIFIIPYTVISIVYRFVLQEDGQSSFEKWCIQCEDYTGSFNIAVLLSFYLAMALNHYKTLLENTPSTVLLEQLISSNVCGNWQRRITDLLLKRLLFCQILTSDYISTFMRNKNLILKHFLEEGILPEERYKEYKNGEIKYRDPLDWIRSIVTTKGTCIFNDITQKEILKELDKFSDSLDKLVKQCWNGSVLAAVGQICTSVVYLFFIPTLFSRQYLDPNKGYKGHEIDLLIPFFTIIQLLFYVVFVELADQLINPFGHDDDYFETNWYIDYGLKMGQKKIP